MRYFLVVGEPSGDLHASHLMRALLHSDSQAQFAYIGGKAMRSVADGCVRDSQELAIMGFWEVLTHLRTISRNLQLCMEAIRAFAPDVVILVDFAGFNLRIAKQCNKLGIRVAYYILPKLWAWGAWRIKRLRSITRLYAILPFEVDYFRAHGLSVHYLGNPLMDELPFAADSSLAAIQTFRTKHALDARPLVALLPGSRLQELQRMLGLMASLTDRFPAYQFVVAGTSVLAPEAYREQLQAFPDVKLVMDQTHQLLQASVAAIVTSGTATLETALLGVPQVVVYRGNPLSIFIARRLANVRWISLVNLILGREVVRELIQESCTVDAMAHELQKILPDQSQRLLMLEAYAELETRIGSAGCAQRIAEQLYTTLQQLIQETEKRPTTC